MQVLDIPFIHYHSTGIPYLFPVPLLGPPSFNICNKSTSMSVHTAQAQASNLQVLHTHQPASIHTVQGYVRTYILWYVLRAYLLQVNCHQRQRHFSMITRTSRHLDPGGRNIHRKQKHTLQCLHPCPPAPLALHRQCVPNSITPRTSSPALLNLIYKSRDIEQFRGLSLAP